MGSHGPAALGASLERGDAVSRQPIRRSRPAPDGARLYLFSWTTRYRYKNLQAFLSIENLTNTQWREGQFFFASRLPGEPAGGVPDIHSTPGNPRTVLGGLALRF
jgi:hypothetical protein